MTNRIRDPDDRNVTILVKSNEKFIFVYHDRQVADVLGTLSRYAVTPDIEFSWWDATVLSQRIRKQVGVIQ